MDVRPLEDDDRRQWDPLWQGYLDFYEEDLADATTERTWLRLVDDDPSIVGLGAFDGDTLVGFCHLIFHPSTWSQSSYCYLEDLFVSPAGRRRGVARALIEATEREARRAGASNLYWQTHVTNTTARHLYDQVAKHDGFIIYERDLSV